MKHVIKTVEETFNCFQHKEGEKYVVESKAKIMYSAICLLLLLLVVATVTEALLHLSCGFTYEYTTTFYFISFNIYLYGKTCNIYLCVRNGEGEIEL